MQKRVTIALGVLLLLMGVLSFVPAATPYGDNGVTHLFGIFLVDQIQSIVHVATGVVALLAGSSHRYSRWFLQIGGIAYALIALGGFIQTDTVVGLFGVNLATNILHAVIAAVMLAVGFSPSGPRSEEVQASSPKPSSK